MPPHHVTNFEMRKYYQSEPKFKDVHSHNNLGRMRGWGPITYEEWGLLSKP